jgi:hypothetical protein
MRYIASQIPSLAALESEIKEDELTAGVQLSRLAAESTEHEAEASARGKLGAGPVIDGFETPPKASRLVAKEMTAEESLALDRELAGE